MTRIFGIGVSLAILLALESTTHAQVTPNGISITSFDPDDAVAPVSNIEGTGWRVGESTVLHPVIGMETGFLSNVFYTPTNPDAAAVLRFIAQIGAGTPDGLRTGTEEVGDNAAPIANFNYRASARASWDQLIGNNNVVSQAGGLGLGANLKGNANAQGKVVFGFSEDYTRLIRAANYETDANVNRDINAIDLQLMYKPPQRTLSGTLYYDNYLDIFERSENQFANRIFNVVGLRPAWRWLPQTTVYADVSQGVTTGIGSTPNVLGKVTSYPFMAKAGVATLLTPSVTLNGMAGYGNGFYSSGPSYSAFIADVDLGYRYSPLGRVAFTYDLLYQDSINANFYRDHVFRLWLQHLVSPIIVMAQAEFHIRHYDGIDIVMGPPTRDDLIYALVAGVHYNIKASLAMTLDYRFTDVSTSYRYNQGATMMVDPSFVRHEVLLGVRWAL